ncbi:NACHT domain-containing protein [Streptomyces durbertensis]|uniref:NACHT domain-containing protein n=1 Tax=Streptomyces durbertensis TaxID=2448886 RepID=A0ABR6EHA8_9ACTN|nr:NACHT domain-containing protein [Streptomyces durbertensis]MBB1244713.1 NACHT domain-containing protein [Streptomyces durbertensis]
MDAGVVGVRLASSVVAPLVKQLFARESAGAGLVDRPIRVGRLVAFGAERRELGEREVQKIAAKLVERAVATHGPGERPVPADEDSAVADALTRTLLALGDIEMDDVQAVGLGHQEFACRLREAAGPAASRELSADGERLWVGLLDVACLHILHFFTQRSTFVARQQVEQSRLLHTVVDRLDWLLERLPAPAVEDHRFERRYADFVVRKHGTLTIYGLDLQQGREWPLDSAYLSLETTASVSRDGLLSEEAPHGASHDESRQPAERALAGHDRVLLRGLAGSGKTTLVQWLAVTAARQEPTAELPQLFGRVPFVLPLRTLTRGGGTLPLPRDFLAATGCPLAGAQPTGWVERVLAAGRGLLLVDGIDEVPEAEREGTRRWLADLLTAFPDSLCLVTSRPSAVSEHWLGAQQFTELTLSPMSRADTQAFVRRWHTAAQAGKELETKLLGAIRSRPDLGQLSTNPLMCGLICALHRERRGHLPRGRKALYDAALSMLLYRRDLERDVPLRRGGVELDDESQIELLQKLAYWLIRNGRSELDQTDAVRLIGRVLPAMPHVAAQGDAAQVFRHLLVRSGLLREPAPGAVDFVHRTFQDYLGAREAVEECDFDLLVANAHLDQWEDVIRMAVAHARPDERAQLLEKLLARGDADPACRTRLHLLATACLEHATKLDPAIRSRVERSAAALLPPMTFEEAKGLAAAGPIVLELLPGPEEIVDNNDAVSIIHTAAQIGTDNAIPLLLRYIDHPWPGVAHQLAGHWDRFDTDTYAKEIIAPIVSAGKATVVVRSFAELAHISRLNASRVRLRGDFHAQEIRDALSCEHLVALELVDNHVISDLAFLASYLRLNWLMLTNCTRLADLEAIRSLPLHHLGMWELPKLPSLDSTGSLSQLRTLNLGKGLPWQHADVLPSTATLSSLTLPTEAVVPRLTRWPQLRSLHIGMRTSPLEPGEYRHLATAPALDYLNISCSSLEGLGATDPLHNIHRLGLRCDDHSDLTLVPRLFPSLNHLELVKGQRSATEIDLAPLAELTQLEKIALFGITRPSGIDELPAKVEVRHVPRIRKPGFPS